MNNKQILERAIQKAFDGGWRKGRETGTIIVHENDSLTGIKQHISIGLNGYDINTIIFNHDFAKALWGEEYVDNRYGTTYDEYQQQVKDGMHYPIDYEWNDLDVAWGYHLKHMVLADDPIKYLGENI